MKRRVSALSQGYLAEAGGLLAEGIGWAGLGGDALAFVLAQLAQGGRWLVVVDAADRRDTLVRALRFYHPKPHLIEAFPSDEGRPYDGFSPAPEGVAQRLRVLERVDRGGDLIVVADAKALLQRLPSQATRHQGTQRLEVEQDLERDTLVRALLDAGYLSTGRAEVPGTFAVRGDVLDVWPSNAKAPVRLDFFDDELESIRRLSPDRLLPTGTRRRVTILPAREERVDQAALERLREELKRHVGPDGEGLRRRRRIMEDLRSGVRFAAMEDWLPALVPTVAPLEAFRGMRLVVQHPDDVAATLRDVEDNARRRYDLLEEQDRPLVPPSERFEAAASVVEALREEHHVFDVAAPGRSADLGARGTDGFTVRGTELGPVVNRLTKLAAEDCRVVLVVEGEGHADTFMQMLEPYGMRPKALEDPLSAPRGKISLAVGDLPRGFVSESSGWCFVPVSALFGIRHSARAERAHALFDVGVRSVAQLKEGDVVVHRMHGVGRYRGLTRVPVGGTQQDFAEVEYKGGDLLLLPATSLDQLSRFKPSNADAAVRLDKLGGVSWARRKGKVRDNLLQMADELMRLHARRELATRPPYPAPGPRYAAFEARFPHEETPDQATAIRAVQEDLSRPYPMDRLICGDVGFGKTEVAERAAMRVVEAGRQVAVLCPTTVLAYQHHLSFVERFRGDPSIKVGMLSRFSSGAEEAETLRGLQDGSMHIVVGTTSLLGRRVRYRDLGLLVVDEEHRFGVKQKDRLKKLRAEVDVLSMSATPIPRSLQMALGGLREMSVMATPPADRLAVRTSVARLSEIRVRDAIRSEMERGGQSFVIHNRVESIHLFTERLRGWVPEARFGIAHGQMEDATLEQVLVDFIAGRFDVLVCTTIVESGIDLPNVNTMLVDRADRFGLAQLYQLRGRVGRSDRRATCLLLTPEEVPRDARRRLQVLVENTRLGSGFRVAAADLELRGGGNLLGASQSGNIDRVGWETWVELLEEAVRSAQGDQDRARLDPEVEVPVDAFIPDSLVKDAVERLGWYRRLAGAGSALAVDRVVEELEGWVGELPVEARNLGGIMAIKQLCREVGVERCSWLKVRVVIELHPSSTLDASAVQAVIKRYPRRFSTKKGDDRVLFVRFSPQEAKRPLQYLRWVFAQLQRRGL